MSRTKGSEFQVIRGITQALGTWLSDGFRQIGQILIQPSEKGGYELRHFQDAGRTDLVTHRALEDARTLANIDELGTFRPLKTAPNLRRGWRMTVSDLPSLRCALDSFYPAMLGVLLSHGNGRLSAVCLRETLNRQSGMYSVTKKLIDSEAQRLIAGCCNSGGGCLKTILWRIDPGLPVTSLPHSKFDP